MPQTPQRPRFRMEFRLPADLEPVFSNLVRIAHTPSEFILDFARLLPGDPAARVVARVIVSPVALKLLHRALTENLTRYEATFGEITLPGAGQPSLAELLFRPPPTDDTDGTQTNADDTDDQGE
ncbi:MAG: DUF3467 domain-containing protein [Chloroflexi bacterium]|nr:DUF3467 domain-containing protein [Chloroflexota bacterium]